MKYIIIILMLLVQVSCQKTPPVLVYQSVNPRWRQLRDPAGRQNPQNKVYPKDYRGPQACTPPKDIFKCVSNDDYNTDLSVKAEMIQAIKGLLLMIDEQNNLYMEYMGTSCHWWQFACKKERARHTLEEQQKIDMDLK